jgi:hypothetical protein
MSSTVDPRDWHTWPRRGNRVDAPADSTMDERLAGVWALTCEAYGIDPDNPPPMRRDIIRIVRRPDR